MDCSKSFVYLFSSGAFVGTYIVCKPYFCNYILVFLFAHPPLIALYTEWFKWVYFYRAILQ